LSFIKNIPPHSGTDRELIDSYRKSADLTILAALYQRYMDLLYSVCLKYLEDPELSRDAVMAIFEELAQKLLKHEVDNFKGWLYTLAKNHCLMQLRSSKRMKTRELDPDRMQLTENAHLNGGTDLNGAGGMWPGTDMNSLLEKEMHLDNLSQCLEALSKDQKLTVELFYLQNKCYNEIETITGLDWNKVRSLIQNGRRNLKICMEKSAKSGVSLTTVKK